MIQITGNKSIFLLDLKKFFGFIRHTTKIKRATAGRTTEFRSIFVIQQMHKTIIAWSTTMVASSNGRLNANYYIKP